MYSLPMSPREAVMRARRLRALSKQEARDFLAWIEYEGPEPPDLKRLSHLIFLTGATSLSGLLS